MQAIISSRSRNAHDRSGLAYIVVPRADGTLPPSWPQDFERDALVDGPIGPVDNLLMDFGLPHGAPLTLLERRNLLALHIGTNRV